MAFNVSLITRRIANIKNRRSEIEKVLRNKGIDIEQIENDSLQGKQAFALNKKKLGDLKMACIMDQFTFDSYSPECILFQLSLAGWKEEMEEFQPDLLFIESAWQGKNGEWYRKIANGSEELYLLTNYCKEKNIPVVFWNKEDPIYTDTFMPAAKCADFVFTTDIDCIRKYKERLKHDRVYLLHFAAQPQKHNPVEKFTRKDKFCFAGAYYHRYPKRAETFDKFAKVFVESKGLDIYDRNYQNSRPEHAFPHEYDPYILGRLESDEIDLAYKGYYYGVNMNSVEQSQTMFARRVFEMLASNTVTVGNYSRGVKNLFGDLTICTNDVKTLKSNLELFCREESTYRKYRLMALRKVLLEHLYEDRLSYLVSTIFKVNLKKDLPNIKLFLRGIDIARGIKLFRGLEYKNKTLYIVGDERYLEEQVPKDLEDIVIISNEYAEKTIVEEIIGDSMIGILSPGNYYGKNYLLDLALTKRYAMAYACGKASYYQYANNQCELYNKDNSYKYAEVLLTDRSVFGKEIENIQELSISEFIEMEAVKSDHMLSIDEFNFCEGCTEDLCPEVEDIYIADQGISMNELEKRAEHIRVNLVENEGRQLSYEEILTWAGNVWKDGVSCERLNEGICITSKLGDSIRYIYFNQTFDIDEFAQEKKLNLFLGGNGNLECIAVCIFYDKENNKIAPSFVKSNMFIGVDVPDGAKYFKLGIRLSGTGKYMLQQIELGGKRNPNELSCFLNKGKSIILTNTYPSEKNLYRNMFVHKRVKSYKDQGLVCDLMEFTARADERYREFEGINIISGYEEILFNLLETGTIETVCVHFLDEKMWKVLKEFKDRIRILVWIHGAEVQPWWRRTCNYRTSKEEEDAKVASKGREELWNEVFGNRKDYNIHFIFVSQAFADEVCEDYKVVLDKNEYSIIHNCIDTDMFSYIPKTAEQRKKILSIRPYANRKYANDLSTKCILELSKKPFFKELEFCMYGDGELFEETLHPLEKFKNVHLHKEFLRQDEIAQLHKKYGLFLVPTRVDAQGVSRDEAMSSGLVAVTNGIPAILEFTDDECAIVTAPEDYKEMADGIEKLYNNPELFLKLSANARKRVEGQTSKKHTIDREVLLISGDI